MAGTCEGRVGTPVNMALTVRFSSVSPGLLFVPAGSIVTVAVLCSGGLNGG
jgi:hypothetical protein